MGQGENRIKTYIVQFSIQQTIEEATMKKEIFDRYTNAIAKQFHLTLDEMFENSKKRDIVDARQMLYYACMERPIRLSYIKKFLALTENENDKSIILLSYLYL